MLRSLLLFIALTTSLCFAQEPAIRAKEEAFRKAVATQNAKALDPMLTAEFVAIWPDGSKSTRDDQMKLLGNTVKVEDVQISDIHVSFYGDTAIVTGTWNIKGVWEGKPMGPRAYTHVWVKEGDDWKLASRHLTIQRAKSSEQR